MDIRYKIKFLTDWHCGSGLAAGADIDMLAIKDENGYPYVPGKTIKGLLREAVETISSLRNTNSELGELFGQEDADQGFCKAYYSNAELPVAIKNMIPGTEIKYLFRKISSTRIDENGIAVDHSLHSIETAVPCSLVGVVKNVPEEMCDLLEDGLKFIKRIGLYRNRGLGRCEITIINPE